MDSRRERGETLAKGENGGAGMRIEWAIFALLAVQAGADGIDDQIAKRCVDEWPDNYEMQEYCAGQQRDGLVAVHDFMTRYGITSENDKGRYVAHDPAARILHDCASQWKGRFGVDWTMTAYCIKRQEAAALRLGKLHE
jgi:hypothetical protein